MINNWYVIIFIAIIIQTIMELLKQWFQILSEKEWIIRLITIVLGVIVALAYDADIFKILEMPAKIPYIGIVLTGILAAGGSNIIFDIIKRIKGAKDEIEYPDYINNDVVDHEIKDED